jgi:hypothetical protein
MCFDSSKHLKEKFEDTKGVIRIRKSKNDRSHYDKKIKKKEKQWSTTNYTENWRSNNRVGHTHAYRKTNNK